MRSGDKHIIRLCSMHTDICRKKAASSIVSDCVGLLRNPSTGRTEPCTSCKEGHPPRLTVANILTVGVAVKTPLPLPLCYPAGPKGSYSTSAEADAACIPCPAGTYAATVGVGASSCTNCPVGSSSEAGSLACEPCESLGPPYNLADFCK